MNWLRHRPEPPQWRPIAGSMRHRLGDLSVKGQRRWGGGINPPPHNGDLPEPMRGLIDRPLLSAPIANALKETFICLRLH